jgi:hypothetical protein
MLQHLTRQQIRQSFDDADLTSLRIWVHLLCSAAGWCDPTTDQVTSPGLARFLLLHAGRGHCLFSVQLEALPPAALASLALLASRPHGQATCCRPSPGNHRHPAGPRQETHP